MNINRRRFLKISAAGAILPSVSVTAGSTTQELVAAPSEVQLLPDGYNKTAVWGFNGIAPGPEIRVQKGALVRRRLLNKLSEATSVHWHGIRIQNNMDGVAGLTQKAIEPGKEFAYEFAAPDAGTYWYHAHNRSYEQVARGLYGALIVEEDQTIDVDREEVLIIDDWLIDPDSAQIVSSFGAMHDFSHAGRLGNLVTANGTYNLGKTAKQNERIRLRLINASNARIFQLAVDGMDGWIVALDGMPLKKPRKIQQRLLLSPAQRIDLIVDIKAEMGAAANIRMVERNQTISRISFDIVGKASVKRQFLPEPLPPNKQALPDLSNAREFVLRMEGGAMGGMSGAIMDGRMSSMREMMRKGNFWAFNGRVGSMEADPLAAVSKGETVRLRIINETAFPHAMHLHGMHFHELEDDQNLGALRDTTLVERGKTQDIAFVADNPGKWLLHCHMLSHAASGMTTWIDVV